MSLCIFTACTLIRTLVKSANEYIFLQSSSPVYKNAIETFLNDKPCTNNEPEKLLLHQYTGNEKEETLEHFIHVNILFIVYILMCSYFNLYI